jgi:hypothetical protein
MAQTFKLQVSHWHHQQQRGKEGPRLLPVRNPTALMNIQIEAGHRTPRLSGERSALLAVIISGDESMRPSCYQFP